MAKAASKGRQRPREAGARRPARPKASEPKQAVSASTAARAPAKARKPSAAADRSSKTAPARAVPADLRQPRGKASSRARKTPMLDRQRRSLRGEEIVLSDSGATPESTWAAPAAPRIEPSPRRWAVAEPDPPAEAEPEPEPADDVSDALGVELAERRTHAPAHDPSRESPSAKPRDDE